jgi:hypothetical protein
MLMRTTRSDRKRCLVRHVGFAGSQCTARDKVACWLSALTYVEPPDADKRLQKQHEQNKLALRSYKQQNPEFLEKMNKVTMAC